MAVHEQPERLRLAEEASTLPWERITAVSAARLLMGSSSAFLTWGQRTRAEEVWRVAWDLAERTRGAAENVGFRPELALARLQWAERCVEEQRLNAAEVAQLEATIDDLQAMHMQPAMERALVCRDQAEGARAQRRALSSAGGLTAREEEVAVLLAEGLQQSCHCRGAGDQRAHRRGPRQAHSEQTWLQVPRTGGRMGRATATSTPGHLKLCGAV
jgi:DNA-binding CsgD family transcriptional regulator